MTYLDNAATSSPKPRNTLSAFTKGIYMSANPGRSGHSMSVAASQEVYTVRKKLSAFFNLRKPENVIFTGNCTGSINTALRGLLKKGDSVITTVFEHNSVLRTLEKMKQEGIIEYSVAEISENDDETVYNFERLIRDDTGYIVCTHASNVFGNVLPVEKIGELCRKYGIKLVLDGAQTAGILPIDMEKQNIYALCVPGHKGLYGAMGTGALLLREDDIEPFITGGTGSDSASLKQPDYLPDRLESGTLNLPGIMSLGGGLDFIEKNGLRKIHGYEMKLLSELYDFLDSDRKFLLYKKPDPKRDAPVLSFNIRGMHSEEVAELLNLNGICVRAGYHCAYPSHKFMGTEETGTVRVSTGVFNTVEDIKKIIISLNKIEKQVFI